MVQTTKGTAIVTGAARGLGAEMARRLASEQWRVAVLDLEEDACRDTVSSITAEGGTAAAFGVDVADEASVTSVMDRLVETLGAPTVLVNNAGITRDNLLFKMSADDWDSVMSVHLRGTFLMSRAAQTYMTENRWGRIVNVSSTSALGNRGQANYAAAKAGLQGFTKTLALELGKFGVTVNAVAPGFVETEMTRAMAQRMGMDFDEFTEQRVARIAVGRIGVPADVAHVVSFFVSEGAGYVSGQVLYVSGGPAS